MTLGPFFVFWRLENQKWSVALPPAVLALEAEVCCSPWVGVCVILDLVAILLAVPSSGEESNPLEGAMNKHPSGVL